jgi:ParB-like chromosome segregation protein Spo0J
MSAVITPDVGLEEWATGCVGEVTSVAIRDLVAGNAVRTGPEDAQHVRLLAALEEPLPPILVHRHSMRVIDGMHRVHAAMLRGATHISARYFEGSPDDAFVQAVQANVTHGKPLTLPERAAAARRIIASRGHFSDRTIAKLCGIAPRSVASLRRESAAGAEERRLGRDGRLRPLDPNAGRLRAVEVLQADRSASLREVARRARVSVGTVRDVVRRLDLGQSPLTTARVDSEVGAGPEELDLRETIETDLSADEPAACGALQFDESHERLAALVNDRAFAATTEGQCVVDWLRRHATRGLEFQWLVDAVPLSRTYVVAELAKECVAAWSAIAELAEERARRSR